MEIDANNDNYVTLIEFNQAMARRAEAALNASNLGPGAKYVKPKYLKDDHGPTGSEAEATDLSSAIAQKRGNEFEEFLGGDPSAAHDQTLPVHTGPTLKMLDKSF